MRPMDPARSDDAARPADAAKPVDAARSVDAARPVYAVTPVDATGSVPMNDHLPHSPTPIPQLDGEALEPEPEPVLQVPGTSTLQNVGLCMGTKGYRPSNSMCDLRRKSLQR